MSKQWKQGFLYLANMLYDYIFSNVWTVATLSGIFLTMKI